MAHHNIYQPLPNTQRSIRLLSIAPGWPDNPVHVGLITIEDIDEAPVYVALSYVWGLTYAVDPIFCNGIPKRVTKSLGDALRAFRPLPSTDPEEANQNGVDILSTDDVCHSSRHIWSNIACNKWERPLENHTDTYLFWIDALCIDQENIEERSSQVKGMREIYQNAQSVRVWFGLDLDYNTGDEAFHPVASSWLDKFIGRARLSDYGDMPVVLAFIAQAFHNSKNKTTSHDGRVPGFPPTYAPEWRILRKFFQHPWFYRVWTVQEIAMARHATVILGDWELDWNALALAVAYLNDTYHGYSLMWKSKAVWKLSIFDSSWTSLPLDSVSYMCRIRSGVNERPLLMGLLVLGRNRGATQPVDYVFAVLNLSADWSTVNSGVTQKPYIEPDYDKSIARTFADVTTWLITFHKSLDVLAFVSQEDHSSVPDCPSWVPVWSQPKRSCALAHGEYRWSPEHSTIQSSHRRLLRETGYNADSKEPMPLTSFHELIETNILRTSGLSLSQIVAVSKPLVPIGEAASTIRDELSTEERNFVESAWSMCEDLMTQTITAHQPSDDQLETRVTSFAAPYKTKQEIISAMILTLCANRDEDWARADHNPETEYDAIACLAKILGTRFLQAPTSEKVLKYFWQKGDRHAFQATISLICSWRTFFLTESGHMGIGPSNVQKGDTVAVLFGSTIPFILRPHQGQPTRNILLGECYVHGIMDGELVADWRLQSDRPADVFELE